jgi:hypothetical protein
MNNIIQSLLSPHLQRGNYSHMDGGVMDGRWRDVGDDGDEDLLQIPIPAGCQNGVSGSESRYLMVEAQRKSIWEKRRLPDIIESGGICRRKERSRGWPRCPHTRLAWLGLAAPPVRVGPSSLSSVSSFGSVGLLVKYDFWWFFPNFYWKLDFCTKTRHQSNSAENSVSPC